MKIHSLRFKNLNSLVGEWCIDFTDEAFLQSGIFAITGPTGAGKTTILDALCLALYGRTPRLSKITKSGNEIMSRMAGECFAEVTFGIGAGVFTAHWSQRRARLKYNGELQTPKHELADALFGKIIGTSITGVAPMIIDITGMDFDRFTRSMLLAQGGFAAFLDATADQRSPILEQITGTEIYSRISMAVHERLRSEREKCDVVEAELGGVALLSLEEEQQLHEELASRQVSEQQMVQQQKELSAAIEWLHAIDTITRELARNIERRDVLTQEYNAFGVKRSALHLSIKASALDGDFRLLGTVRNQLQSDAERLARSNDVLLKQQERRAFEQISLVQAERAFADAKTMQLEALPRLRQVRELDMQIAQITASLTDLKRERDAVAKDHTATINNRKKEQEKCAAAVTDQKRVEAYICDHASDAQLIADFAGLKEKIAAFITGEHERVKAADACTAQFWRLESTKKQLTEHTTAIMRLKQTQLAAQEAVAMVKNDMSQLLGDRLLREYRAEYDALLQEQRYQQRIADLETERKRLEDGKPCPLCGATEHPFAQGNIPETTALSQRITALFALINRAETLESTLSDRSEASRKADTAVYAREQEYTRLQSDIGYHEREAARCADECAAVTGRSTTQQQTLLQDLRQFGITDCTEQSSPDILADLAKRRDYWQRAEQKKATIEKNVAEINATLRQLEGVAELHSRSLNEKEEKLQLLERNYGQLVANRKQLFGTNDPDTEERRMVAAIQSAEAAVASARDQKSAAEKECTTTEATIADLNERIGQQTSERERLERLFAEQCNGAGFANEAAFLAARLTAAERDALVRRDKELAEALAECTSRITDREQALRHESSRNITNLPLTTCQTELQTLAEQTRVCHQTIGAINQRLVDNNAAKERTDAMGRLLEAQRHECSRWKDLHALIGSSDGKKFRNFAQGITFELLLSHANNQLQKLSDRYLLTIDPVEPLECFVIDTYQAGEVRSARNLSGGESFIVSLALALGLSSMSSNNVRVDSLFLDEGFGTLDEDTLETALETLAELKQEGKLIGVISHVSALHERIGTQIRITPVSGGRSVVSGPGCRLC